MPLAPVSPTIRSAWPDEVERAIRMFRLPLNCHSLSVATVSPRDRLVACAALVESAPPREEPVENTAEESPGSHTESAFLLWRAVRGREDSLGELIRRSVEAAAAQGHRELVTLDLLPDSEVSPVRDLLDRLGFQPTERMHEFTMPMSTVHARICSIYDRLAARGTIPSYVRLACLEPDLVPEVRRIVHLAGLLNATDFDARLAGRGMTAFSPELCTIIVDDGVIIGIHLVELADDGFSIPCRWVHEDHRHSWVNIALMNWSARRAAAPDPEKYFCHFSFNSKHHGETQRFARRMGAESTGTRVRLALELQN